MNQIQIANPQPGGQKYTSTKRAAEFVRRGIASVIDDQLYFLSASHADLHRARMEERRLRELAGMTYWNGSVKDLAAMKRPGEVRS